MIELIKKFNRKVSLERFVSHSTNSDITIQDLDNDQGPTSNLWSCGILWGNDDIQGLLIVKFTTLNILAMSSNIFENTKDSLLFEYTKDFMKEYCNFYAGFIKGTFNNQGIDIKLSLPIISNNLSAKACMGGNDKDSNLDKWILKSGNSNFEINSYVKINEEFKKYDLQFLDKDEKATKKDSIEFF
tara:strand:+ start:662 stop:1219 length:558 start_codon:yes stop_codon:yes gene_type:complete